MQNTSEFFFWDFHDTSLKWFTAKMYTRQNPNPLRTTLFTYDILCWQENKVIWQHDFRHYTAYSQHKTNS